VKESGLQDVSPHILRHHFISTLKELSGSSETVSRVVNHQLPGISESTYTHAHFLESEREVLGIWHAHLIEVLGLDLSTVVESETGQLARG